jgi:putative flippase GtrA
VEYSSFIIFVYILDVSALIAQVISYCIAIAVNYLLLKYWTFTIKGKNYDYIRKYTLLVACNLLVTTALLGGLLHLGIPAFFGKVIVVGLAMVWNYVLYNKVIFKQ